MRATAPVVVISSEQKLARRLVIEFSTKVHSQKVSYFAERGFNYRNLRSPEILFHFLSVLSYDMRPFNAEEVWGWDARPRATDVSIIETLEKEGLTLAVVDSATDDQLRSRLQPLKVRNISLSKIGEVDHARGLKQLSRSVVRMAWLLDNLEQSGRVTELRNQIDDVHGFGPTLSAKAILFLVRCFAIGLTAIEPMELKESALGLLGELWIERRKDLLERRNLNVHNLVDELTRIGDPMAIEALYELEDEEIASVLEEEGL